MTKHMPKPSSGANRVSVSHSSLVTKNGEHLYGENFIHDFSKSWKHIKEVDWGDKLKLNHTTYGYMLMEIDWGGKFNYTSCGYPMDNWQGHETHPTGHKTSEADRGGHDHNPNHVNESLISEVDWEAHNPDADDPEQLDNPPHPCPSSILMTYWGEPSSYLWMRMGRERGLPFLSMSRISINNKSQEKISSDSSSRLMETNLMTSFHITNLWNTERKRQTLVHWKMDFTDSNASKIIKDHILPQTQNTMEVATTYLLSGRLGSKRGNH